MSNSDEVEDTGTKLSNYGFDAKNSKKMENVSQMIRRKLSFHQKIQCKKIRKNGAGFHDIERLKVRLTTALAWKDQCYRNGIGFE